MAKQGKFEQLRVLSILDRKSGLQIHSKEIKIIVGRCELGLKTKAKIDYLINYLGYKRIWVLKF